MLSASRGLPFIELDSLSVSQRCLYPPQAEIFPCRFLLSGNEFSTLYAPLIRDGRMEKFYWNPTREDRVGVCMGIFQHDGITRFEVEDIVDTFPGQSIDFFGAMRARVYDDKVGPHSHSLSCISHPSHLHPLQMMHHFIQYHGGCHCSFRHGDWPMEDAETWKGVQLSIRGRGNVRMDAPPDLDTSLCCSISPTETTVM